MREPLRLALFASLASVWACSPLEAPSPPEATFATAVRWAEQGWSDETRHWFHHAPLGTTLAIPVTWFFALEQPSFWGNEGLLSDPAYLRRFGFLVDAGDPTGLPVGLAVDEGFRDPRSGMEYPALGLTCAACHTGELVHGGRSFRFDGGAARLDLNAFERAVTLSILQTALMPGRGALAIKRILQREPGVHRRAQLEQQLDMMRAETLRRLALRRRVHGRDEGVGRVDFWTRVSNALFALQQAEPRNVHDLSAPVDFPPLWDTPWFDWSGYTGSVREPAAQTTLSALALHAGVNLSDDPDRRLASTLEPQSAAQLQRLLAGPRAPYAGAGFTGLTAPEWPEDLFGAIDHNKAVAGQRLYDSLCLRCHLPPPNREDFFDERLWTQGDERRLELHVIPLGLIGTDPALAQQLQVRTVTPPAWLSLGGPAGVLPAVFEVAARALSRLDEDRPAARGQPAPWRPLSDPHGVRTPVGYRARPLDGVWATAPYLHNGSVPTLFALLSPQSERPERFARARAAFDPELVGLARGQRREQPLFDTTLPGNGNQGHVFDNGRGPGIIGRRLTREERFQLIEFLKTLTSRRLPVGVGPSAPKAPAQPPPPPPAP